MLQRRVGVAIAVLGMAAASAAAADTISKPRPAVSALTAPGPVADVGSVLTLSPPTLAIGSVLVGSAGSGMVTIGNTGDAPLTVMAIAFSDATYTQTGGDTAPFVVDAGSNTMVTVSCAPTAVGSDNATMTVTTDTGSGSIDLTCTGIAPMFAITPSPIAFGDQIAGTSSTPIAVVLGNTGTSPVTVSALAIAGIDSADFKSGDLPTLPLALAAGSSSTFHITFTPSGTTAETAELDVTSTDPAGPTTVAITGSGFTPGLTASPTSLDFGSLIVDQGSPPQTVTVTNTSTGTLLLGTIIASDVAVAIDTESTTLALAPGASTTFDAAFTPTTAGTLQAQITIAAQSSSTPLATVAVTGVATAADTASGSSGCATGGEPMPWTMIAVAGALALVLARRSRR